MTNGEKMISAFPNGEVRMCEKGVVFSTGGWCHAYAKEWWEAECKEPTTKNCESCRYYGSHHEVCNYCYKCSLWTEKEPTTKNDLGVDCISRADAIKAMQDKAKKLTNEDTINGLCGAVAILFELPPVTPQPRWIPVSEKLPNDRDWYLGIFKEPDTGWINPLPFICDYVGRETKATTKEHWILRGFTDRDVRDCDYYFNLECVAWMPLPKPCREVEE